MFYIKKEDTWTGLYTDSPIKRGTEILDLSEGELIAERTRTSIQIDEFLHSEHDLGKYINHQKFPKCNCAIDGQFVIAIKDIKAEEELTFDYTTNEDEISHPFIDEFTGDQIG